ncbi:hypothetical protein R1sor_021622 [Riccia sorocarpa]|uniref:Uncharacterized protein n=1 Tax=Riccia sorocarpa TaxID=122646 RepID=A0ABD3GJ13_9MARC
MSFSPPLLLHCLSVSCSKSQLSHLALSMSFGQSQVAWEYSSLFHCVADSFQHLSPVGSLSPQFVIMSHILSNDITCSAAIKELLNEATIVSCNEIVTGLNVDDPAIVVQLTDGLAIQAALALPSRPVGVLPSAHEDGAMNNFRSWLISQAHEADGVTAASHQFGGANTTA